MDTIANAVVNFNVFALSVAASVVVTLIASCLLKKILPRNLVNVFTNSAYFLKMVVIDRNISKNTHPRVGLPKSYSIATPILIRNCLNRLQKSRITSKIPQDYAFLLAF